MNNGDHNNNKNILVVDTENSIFQSGNPFSRCNKCALVAVKQNNKPSFVIPIEYFGPVKRTDLELLQNLVSSADLLVGFNLKYDLHWLNRYDIDFSGKRFWCTQLVQFILTSQSKAYPGLDESCEYWKIGEKKNSIINEEFWSKGVDTFQIPYDLLESYARQDVDLTYQLFLKQEEFLRTNSSKSLNRLISLSNQDLEVLREMECNGLIFDVDEANRRQQQLQQQIQEIDKKLSSYFGKYPINFNSNDHLSACLYGGTIEFVELIPYQHTFKTGKRAGQTVTRYHRRPYAVTFPRLVNPLKKSELKKAGFWSTSEDVLKLLPARGTAKKIIDLLRQRSKLEKLASTYYAGWSKKIVEMDWEPNRIHSQFNQVVVVTGRLSSSNPNQQNIPDEAAQLIQSRF